MKNNLFFSISVNVFDDEVLVTTTNCHTAKISTRSMKLDKFIGGDFVNMGTRAFKRTLNDVK